MEARLLKYANANMEELEKAYKNSQKKFERLKRNHYKSSCGLLRLCNKIFGEEMLIKEQFAYVNLVFTIGGVERSKNAEKEYSKIQDKEKSLIYRVRKLHTEVAKYLLTFKNIDDSWLGPKSVRARQDVYIAQPF